MKFLDLKYLPLLLSSLLLFIYAYRERNKEQKVLKNPVLLGIIGLFYISLMSIDYSFMAVLVGIAGLIILIINIFRK